MQHTLLAADHCPEESRAYLASALRAKALFSEIDPEAVHNVWEVIPVGAPATERGTCQHIFEQVQFAASADRAIAYTSAQELMWLDLSEVSPKPHGFDISNRVRGMLVIRCDGAGEHGYLSTTEGVMRLALHDRPQIAQRLDKSLRSIDCVFTSHPTGCTLVGREDADGAWRVNVFHWMGDNPHFVGVLAGISCGVALGQLTRQGIELRCDIEAAYRLDCAPAAQRIFWRWHGQWQPRREHVGMWRYLLKRAWFELTDRHPPDWLRAKVMGWLPGGPSQNVAREYGQRAEHALCRCGYAFSSQLPSGADLALGHLSPPTADACNHTRLTLGRPCRAVGGGTRWR